MTALTMTQFAEMFGGSLDDKTKDEIAGYDWRYCVLNVADANRVVLDLLKRIEGRAFSVAGENVERWQKGWSENLDEFRRTGDVKALEPKYLRPAKFLRLDSQFIEPMDPMFEANWYKVFRGWFARQYLAQYDYICEFGCGSGHNIAFLMDEFPNKYIFGYDWAEASGKIIRELQRGSSRVHGGHFDFFNPPNGESGWFGGKTAVLTIGALEQTGLRWRPFLEFLQRTKPAMCFHIEPIVEWYNPGNLVDYTAIKLHEGRGFWRGFVNEITPLRGHRTGFGSLMLEGYSQIAWSPQVVASELARIDALEGAP